MMNPYEAPNSEGHDDDRSKQLMQDSGKTLKSLLLIASFVLNVAVLFLLWWAGKL